MGEGMPNGLDSVQVWVFGHTHHCTDLLNGRVRLVANQRGYMIAGKVEDTSIGFLQAVVQKLQRKRETKQYSFDVEKVVEI